MYEAGRVLVQPKDTSTTTHQPPALPLLPRSRARTWKASLPPVPLPPHSPACPAPCFPSWMSKRSTVWHRVSPLTPQPDALVAD